MIVKGDTPFHETRPGKIRIAAKFKTTGVACLVGTETGGVAIVERPAVIESDIVLVFVEIPAIIGVFPRTTAAEDIASSRMKLAAEAVGISTTMPWVVIQIRIAVDNLVGADTIRDIQIAIAQSDLQTTIAIVMEGTKLNNIAAALDLHPVVAGPVDFQSLDVPEACVCGDKNPPIGVGIGHRGKIQDRVLVWIIPDLYRRQGRAGIGELNGCRIREGAASHIDGVARPDQGDCRGEVGERCVDHARI